MQKWAVVRAFQEIADLTEIKGEEPYKARIYRKAAEAIERLNENLEELASQNRLQEIPGVGPKLADKIVEILNTGTCKHLERLRSEIPPGLLELLTLPGLGGKTISVIYRTIGVTTLDELEAAAREHRLRSVPGIGSKKEGHILTAIQQARGKADSFPLGMVDQAANELVRLLSYEPAVERVSLAGEVRRRVAVVKGIEIVAATQDPERVIRAFTNLPLVKETIDKSRTWAKVKLVTNVPAELILVKLQSFWVALLHATGSSAHNAGLFQVASQRGLRFDEDGIYPQGSSEPLTVESEGQIYDLLNLQYVPPELREGRGEVEAALNHSLPDLISTRDIKGDLHVHTNWSDGLNSIEEMAEEARKLGYHYIAICDHSKSLAVAGGLDEARLLRQIEQINALNKRWDDFRILTGIEVDVLSDGRLDISDEVLDKVDIVIASIHTGFRQSREQITARLISALNHKSVDVVAHPTGRLLGRRDPYEVDVEALIKTAQSTGKILEINASPDRLDLDDVNSRWAADLGVPLVINTDAHGIGGFQDMSYGVDVGRKAWLTKSDVINTLTLPELLSRLQG